MRTTPIPTCEKNFRLRGFLENLRTDGRLCDEFRKVSVLLGSDRGSCLALLGCTKVLAHVSCDIVNPKRAMEGEVFVNVEMSPMAAPNFEVGRLGHEGMELCRLLERIIKESGCIDVESLCIQAEESAFQIRVDVHVLEHDGSLVDCASIAAITALRHFRKPDVSVAGEKVTVHSADERDPVPLNIFHQPLCVTVGFVENGRVFVVDPTEREEEVLEGYVVVGVNSRREVCALHSGDGVALQKAMLLRCASMAERRCLELVDLIESTIARDAEKRSKDQVDSFAEAIDTIKLTGHEFSSSLKEVNAPTALAEPSTSAVETAENDSQPRIVLRGSAAHLTPASGSPSLMTEASNSVEMELVDEITSTVENNLPAADDEVNSVNQRSRKRLKLQQRTEVEHVSQLLEDIEDDVVILEPEDLGYEKKITVESPEVEEINLVAALKTKKSKKKKL